MQKVTDPELLAQLDKVTDPNILAQLEGNNPVTNPPAETQISTAVPRWFEALSETGQGVAMGAGDIAGIAGPGAKAVVGGAATSAWDQFMKGIGSLAGYYKPQTAVEAFKTAGESFVKGAAGGMVGDIAGKGVTKGIEKVLEYTPYKSKVIDKATGTLKPEVEQFLRTTEKYGVEPTPSEIVTEQKLMNILETVGGYTPGSMDIFYKRQVSNLKKLNEARNKLIGEGAEVGRIEEVGSKIRDEVKILLDKTQKGGEEAIASKVNQFTSTLGIKNRYEAGAQVKDIAARTRQALIGERDSAYSQFSDALPMKGADIVPTDESIIKGVDKILSEEMSKLPPARNLKLISMLDSIKKSVPKTGQDVFPEGINAVMYNRDPGIKAYVDEWRAAQGDKTIPLTWNGLKETNTYISEKISQIVDANNGRWTETARKYSQLRSEISNLMDSWANKQSPDLLPLYNQAREAARIEHEIFNQDVMGIMHDKTSNVLKKIIDSGDLELLRNIKSNIPDAMEPLKDGYFKKIIDDSTNRLTGVVDPTKLKKILGDPNGKMVMGELATKDEIAMLTKIADEGMRFQNVMAKDETVKFLKTLSGTSNENVFRALFKPNNTRNIQIAKKFLSPERITELEGLAVENILKTTSGVTYKEGVPLIESANILPVSSAKAFKQYEATLRELLPSKRFGELKEFVHMGNHMARVETLSKNSSLTGQTLIAYGTIKGMITSILSSGPAAIATQAPVIGLPYVISRMYMSPGGRQYFLNAMKLDPYSKEAINSFVKALTITAEESGGQAIKDRKQRIQGNPKTLPEVFDKYGVSMP